MSNYAGIIGGAIGAVVGFYAGGPAGAKWGWAIGQTLGGAYAASQQVIPGPKIGDVQQQTSQEGGFRTIVYGRSCPIPGNVIADGGPVIVKKKERQGKGGPKVESESAYRTYAVGFCEGETMLLQAWRNGILVYDAEDPSMASENAKFHEYARWHSGSFDQMPDPDLQGIYGAGGTPAFRGTSYLVLSHEDVTDQRGAWSQWQVRVFRGASRSYTTPPYSAFLSEQSKVFLAPTGGEIRLIVKHSDVQVDATSVGLVPTGGEIRLPVVVATLAPDSITYGLAPTGGEVKSVKVQGVLGPDFTTYGLAPTGGTVAPVPQGRATDFTTYGLAPTGGEISTP